jgi:hypothetical protein
VKNEEIEEEEWEADTIETTTHHNIKQKTLSTSLLRDNKGKKRIVFFYGLREKKRKNSLMKKNKE